jgi:hypothetical protein
MHVVTSLRDMGKTCSPYDCGSGRRRTVSVDWKLSESPSTGRAACWSMDSTLARGCLLSVGEVGVDISAGLWSGSLSAPDVFSWPVDMAAQAMLRCQYIKPFVSPCVNDRNSAEARSDQSDGDGSVCSVVHHCIAIWERKERRWDYSRHSRVEKDK